MSIEVNKEVTEEDIELFFATITNKELLKFKYDGRYHDYDSYSCYTEYGKYSINETNRYGHEVDLDFSPNNKYRKIFCYDKFRYKVSHDMMSHAEKESNKHYIKLKLSLKE